MNTDTVYNISPPHTHQPFPMSNIILARYMPWHALLWWTVIYGLAIYMAHTAMDVTYSKLFFYFTYEDYTTINIFYTIILFIFIRQYFSMFVDWYASNKKITDSTMIEMILVYFSGQSIERVYIQNTPTVPTVQGALDINVS